MWKISEAGPRLAAWKQFRRSLDSMELEPALLAVAAFWQSCPFCPYYLDVDDPDSWPTAWQLISDNYYCDLARALGMLYTVAYSRHGLYHMEIRTYIDPETRYTYNLVCIDNQRWVLNLVDGEVQPGSAIVTAGFELTRVYQDLDLTD